MKLTVLGTSSGAPDTSRHFSGYLFESSSATFLLEAGDGLVRQLLKFQINPQKIDAVVISHTHPDHAAGLFSIIQWMHLEKRTEPLFLYLPVGMKNKFAECLCFFHLYPEHLHFPVVLKDIRDKKLFVISDLLLTPVQNHHLDKHQELAARHHMQAKGFSFLIKETNTKSLFYTSDINAIKYLDNFKENIDIFLSEITHISVQEITDFSQNKKISKTILTHIPKERELEIANQILQTRSIRMTFDGEVLTI